MKPYNTFVASIDFDQPLAPHDLRASMAHARMLGRQRIISASDAQRLVAGLGRLLKRVEKGVRLTGAEDIHLAIERALYKEAGPVAGKLHTARSRNDQTVTALRLYVREHIDVLQRQLTSLVKVFAAQAEAHRSTVMPGFTHLQPGQPILLAQHLLAYAWMFQRDRKRLADVRRRVNVLPLGAAALAGTSFPIDRRFVARQLGFDRVVENSIDAVSDRDFLFEFLSAAALIGLHLSRWSEELIVWSTPAFGYVTLAKEYVTGSSIMPQKQNPDVPELLRGKAGQLLGHLVSVGALIKAQPLAYNRDMQEDKPPVFGAVKLLEPSLAVAAPMTATLTFHKDVLREACREGFLTATDVADALARRGVPFREAHGLVAAVVAYARERKISLDDVPLSVWRAQSPLFGPWVTDVLRVDRAVAARTSEGGTAPSQVARQIKQLRAALRKNLLLFVLSLLPVMGQAENVERTMTLAQSIERSQQNNQKLLLAEGDIRLANLRVQEAWSQFFFKSGLNLNASRYLAENDYVTPLELGNTMLPPSRGLEADTYYSMRVWLRQPLYSGGRSRNTVRLARANLAQARIHTEEIRGEVTYETIKGFLDVLLKQKEIALGQAALSEARRLMNPPPTDLGARLEVEGVTHRLRQNVAEKKRGLEKARLDFLEALGLEFYTQVGLQGALETEPIDLDLARLLAWAQESRVEIRGTDFQQEIDRLALNLSLAERYPTVAFGAAYEVNAPDFPLEQTQWNATLNVSLPLFDGFSSRAQIRQRRAQANQTRVLRSELEDKINREVRDGTLDVVHWQGELEERTRELKRQDGWTQAAARAGAGTKARILENRVETEWSYWQAVHGHRIALAKLEKIVGRPITAKKS